jgi:hypothetical protein
LCHYAFNCTYYTASNWRIRKNEFEKIWKAADMVYFKILSYHLPEGTEYLHQETLARIAQNQNWALPNTKQK